MWKPEVDGTSGECSFIAVICASSISSTSENIQCELINDEWHMIHQDDRLTDTSVELMQISRQLHVGWISINSLKDQVQSLQPWGPYILSHTCPYNRPGPPVVCWDATCTTWFQSTQGIPSLQMDGQCLGIYQCQTCWGTGDTVAVFRDMPERIHEYNIVK